MTNEELKALCQHVISGAIYCEHPQWDCTMRMASGCLLLFQQLRVAEEAIRNMTYGAGVNPYTSAETLSVVEGIGRDALDKLEALRQGSGGGE